MLKFELQEHIKDLKERLIFLRNRKQYSTKFDEIINETKIIEITNEINWLEYLVFKYGE